VRRFGLIDSTCLRDLRPPRPVCGERIEVRDFRPAFQKKLRRLDWGVVNRARLMRQKATGSERILWRHLRNRNFAGYKFRRQRPFGCFRLVFYCPAAKLAIELDGGGHNYRAGQIRDRRRFELLAGHGITVLRFWNHQVRLELDSVLQAIWFALQQCSLSNPHLNPLPLAKGEADFESNNMRN